MRALTIKDRVQRQIMAEAWIAKKILPFLPAIDDALQPFNGEKITLKAGGFTKKFLNAIDGLFPLRNLNVSTEHFDVRTQIAGIYKEYNSLYLTLKIWATWESFPEGSYKSSDGDYYTVRVYLGQLDYTEQTLDIKPIEGHIEYMRHLMTIDYDDVKRKMDLIKDYKNKIKELQSTMPYYSYR